MGERKLKKLPVGIENFAEIRTEGFYYVDKTGLLIDLLNKWSKVNLFTRPRRFGKSLNMSMIKAFLEIGTDPKWFDGLKISEEKELCEKYMGKFPVISISLKDVDGADYHSARALLCSIIRNEAMRFYDLFQGSPYLNEVERQQYEQLVQTDREQNGDFSMPDAVLMGSLKTLSALLEKHYGRKVMILIDEYDVPLAKANEQGYDHEMVLLLRNLFQQALKTNDSLYFAVMTGCLRVAKESIFTGLNNPKILSITTVRFDEYFGFTDEEVKAMLEYYGLLEKHPIVRDWYNGYRFGNVDVYCPWDVISYCDDLTDDPEAEPKNYWSNTSSNEVVKHFLDHMDSGLAKSEMEALIAGEIVVKEINEELTYDRLYDSLEHIWSVLFMTGYLTYRGKAAGRSYRLAIPNLEIRNIFTDQIMSMFLKKVEEDGKQLGAFCDALKAGDVKETERLFGEYLKKTISVRDTFVRKPTKENFYHGILLGILGSKNGWYVQSNQESGDGYSDILIQIEEEGIGIVIEMKYAENGRMDFACQKALDQIEMAGYAEKLYENDCHIILKYGLACYKKQCRVMMKKEVNDTKN